MKLALHLNDFAWPVAPAAYGRILTEIGQSADAAGFSVIAVMDHVWQHPYAGDASQPVLECYSTLTWLAAATERAGLMALASNEAELAGVMGAILFRMGQLQATNLISQEYTNAADENRFDTRIIAPPRGIIYDRFGVVLAQTSKDYQVAVVQNDAENLEEVVGRVAQILGLDSEWARRAIIRVRGGSRYEPQPLKEGLTWEQFNAINVRLPELPGIRALSSDVRAYPYDIVYGHPIGYVQKPTQRDIDRALEAAQCHVERLILFDANRSHVQMKC